MCNMWEIRRICLQRDDDVCSMDCKLELLQNLKLAEEHPSDQSTADFSSRPETTFELDLEGHQWDSRHTRWAKKRSSLCTYEWKPTGLSMIWGSICCEEHFAWYRMNCLNSDVEDAAFIIRRTAYTGSCNQLNDFIF